MTRLQGWVLARMLVPVALVVAFPHQVSDLVAYGLTQLEDPHALVKWGLESSQGLLLRQNVVPWVVLTCAISTGILTCLKGRTWEFAAVVLLVAGLFVPRFRTWPLLMVLPVLLLTGIPLNWLKQNKGMAERISWVPGTLFVFPSLVCTALGTTARPWLHRASVALIGGGLGFGWMWLDCLASYPEVQSAMERWPEDLVDPRIRVLIQSEPGVRADFHGVQIVGHHAIVVAETTTRLMAFDLDKDNPPVTTALAPRWGPESAAPLDAETDPHSGLTWVVDAGHILRELRWDGTEWSDLRTLEMPRPLTYAYLRTDDAGTFIGASVQAAGPWPRLVVSGTLPELDDLTAVDLNQDGSPIPMPREVEWIPSIQKLVLSPDFGNQLWLADIKTGQATPWVKTPTLDGKMRWSKKRDRLVVALPNRSELWVIDPHKGSVDWTVATQPGVRSLALDETRGWVLTASVLTGQIWVQDLETGVVLEKYGTVMPMVREMAVSEERGQAVLSTWVAVYAFEYAKDIASPKEAAK